jgi:HD domain
MNKKDLEHLKKWFTDYVADFYTDDPVHNSTIRLKEKHTKRVCENIMLLGKALGLSNEEMMMAETMALFHDIGRFKQYTIYGTFKDMDSENHALLGLRELTTYNVLDGCTKDEKKWITKAIANHNASAISNKENEKSLLYIRLLRDADKLDIWKVFLDHFNTRDKQPNPVVEFSLPDDPTFSPRVLSAFSQERFVRFQDLNTLNDFKLLLLSWVFDLNFPASIQLVKDRGYVEKIGATLPDHGKTKQILKQIYDYMERHLSPS